jgi:TetR/AcrR family transcriptional regulator, transcriptional repressor for nem operon
MPRPDTGTRQKLIETAIDLIWTSSYGSVSVDDICRAATVKKGSFYHYFPSKEILAATAMEEYFHAHIEPDLKKIFAANISLARQVDLLSDFIIAEQKDVLSKYGRVCGCPLAALASEMISPETRLIGQKAQEIFQICQSYMAQSIAAAAKDNLIPPCDAMQKAAEVNDFITGLMMMARIHNNLDGLIANLKPGIIHVLGIQQNTTIKKQKA